MKEKNRRFDKFEMFGYVYVYFRRTKNTLNISSNSSSQIVHDLRLSSVTIVFMVCFRLVSIHILLQICATYLHNSFFFLFVKVLDEMYFLFHR